jgi:hypothetical protein
MPRPPVLVEPPILTLLRPVRRTETLST